MMEERREIKWYEWIYEINQLWQVQSYRKIGQRENSMGKEPRLIQWRVKKQKCASYLQHTLYKQSWEGKYKKHFKTSRLMAQAFFNVNIDDHKIFITYKDWNYKNCSLKNIVIANAKEVHKLGSKKKF